MESLQKLNEANCGFTVRSDDINGFSNLINYCNDLSNDELNQLGKMERILHSKSFNLKIS